MPPGDGDEESFPCAPWKPLCPYKLALVLVVHGVWASLVGTGGCPSLGSHLSLLSSNGADVEALSLFGDCRSVL